MLTPRLEDVVDVDVELTGSENDIERKAQPNRNLITICDGYLECDVVVLSKLLEPVVAASELSMALVEVDQLFLREPGTPLIEEIVQLVVEGHCLLCLTMPKKKRFNFLF